MIGLSMTTLKFLLFVAAFVTIAGFLLPSISGTAAEADIETAEGDEGTLYVMVVPANYTKTLFQLNPTGSTPITRLDFYFYADHDTTKYFDSTENNFALYVQIINPVTGYEENYQWDNFNPTVTGNLQWAHFNLENVNASWDSDYDVVARVWDERVVGADSIYWTFPLSCKAWIPTEKPSLFDAMVAGIGDIPSTIVDGVRSVLTGLTGAILGEDFSTVVSDILTMDFAGVPTVIRIMVAIPIWFGLAYVMFIIIRSLIPMVGGGSSS